MIKKTSLTLTEIEKQIFDYFFSTEEANLSRVSRDLKLGKSTVFNAINSLVEKDLLEKTEISARKIIYKLGSFEARQKFIEKQRKELEKFVLNKSLQKDISDRKPKLVFPSWYILDEGQMERLKDKFEVITFEKSPLYLDKYLFIQRVKDADIIVLFDMIKIDREMLSECKNLKTVIVPLVYASNLDENLTKDFGVEMIHLDIKNNYKKSARREFVFTALFNLLRPTHKAAEELKSGKFDNRYFRSSEINGKTVGLVGTKMETTYVVNILRVFGAKVFIANPDNPSADPTDFGADKFYTVGQLFDICEVMIFPEDLGSVLDIDPYLSEKMKTEYLIFLSFTLKYNLDKLRELIISKKLKGMFIDYFPDIVFFYRDFLHSEYKKIYNFPNVIITPEIGFLTEESMQENKKQTFEILRNLKF